jgi:hypothetical protein
LQRYTQTFDELKERLSPVDADAIDEFGGAMEAFIQTLPIQAAYGADDLYALLDHDLELAMTLFRLFLGRSKDEFTTDLGRGFKSGVKAFRAAPDAFVARLMDLGVATAMTHIVNRPFTWRDLLTERLAGGRGRAIKGQSRGRWLEDFTETIVKDVFGAQRYTARRRFLGKDGRQTEKADFAIPSHAEPRILIESKAYGATGSKQTDILGDVARIVEQKRHDTDFILVTDGLTWFQRANDLRKLVEMQNSGNIARIYTVQMAAGLTSDLRQLKADHGL